MTGQPFLCPECGCPIQLLYDTDEHEPKGSIEDALEAHNRVVHPKQPDVNRWNLTSWPKEDWEPE